MVSLISFCYVSGLFGFLNALTNVICMIVLVFPARTRYDFPGSMEGSYLKGCYDLFNLIHRPCMEPMKLKTGSFEIRCSVLLVAEYGNGLAKSSIIVWKKFTIIVWKKTVHFPLFK